MKGVEPTFSFDEEGMKKFKAYTLNRVLELKKDIIYATKYRHHTNNSAEGADRMLMDSLKQLQSVVVVSYDTLKVTGIGKTLNGLLRNHPSEKIRKLSRSIVGEWRQMVEKCIQYDAAAAGSTRSHISNTTAGGQGSNKRSRQASFMVINKKQRQQQQVVEVRGGTAAANRECMAGSKKRSRQASLMVINKKQQQQQPSQQQQVVEVRGGTAAAN